MEKELKDWSITYSAITIYMLARLGTKRVLTTLS
jgi:hypothetical protein